MLPFSLYYRCPNIISLRVISRFKVRLFKYFIYKDSLYTMGKKTVPIFGCFEKIDLAKIK